MFNFNDGFYHGHYEIFDNDNFVYIRYSIAPLISGYIADNENASTTIKRFNKNTKKLEAVGIFNGYLKFSDVKDGYLF
ncbi:MAG: hypothetical protein LBU27_06420 [Candidatus Peribacteria bacterium]|nr:hypothetical protein [Candidatus Peribacteria bacterium]